MKNIVVGFDAKRAVRNATGLGNYSRRVIDAMSRYYPDYSYRLYTPSLYRDNRLGSLVGREGVRVFTPNSFSGRLCPSLWRVSSGLSSQAFGDGVNLFHGLSNELPSGLRSRGIASVVTIHDLIFLHYPENYKPIDRAIYNYKFRKAAHEASRIIAISRCTANDIINLYGVSPDKIDVIYQGCDPVFRKQPDERLMERVRVSYGLPKRYILMVGTVEMRKNQMLAIRAMSKLPKDVHLFIVGRLRGDYGKRVGEAAAKMSDRVHLLSGIPFECLPPLYNMAVLSIYPSRYEGFGLPVIESICAGTPVVAVTGSCLEEAGGAGAMYVSPDDVDAMAQCINKLLDDDDLRVSMVSSGRKHIAAFTDDAMAHSIASTYERALEMI